MSMNIDLLHQCLDTPGNDWLRFTIGNLKGQG